MSERKIALITGGNRGLGLEIGCQLAERGLEVVLGVRTGPLGEDTRVELERRGITAAVSTVPLDVTDAADVHALPEVLRGRHGGLDVLVNNAGISLDGWQLPSRLDDQVLLETLQTNLIGAQRVTRALAPLLRDAPAGRIVNVSSTLGALNDMNDPASPYAEVVCPAYRISKAGLNALTIVWARELAGTAVKVNAACPGWVRTRIGGGKAPRDVGEGADTPVWLATLPDDGPTGGFFHDRHPIPW